MGTVGVPSAKEKEAARQRANRAPAASGPRMKLLFLVTEDWYFCSHRLALGRAAVDAGYDVVVATRVRDHGEEIRRAGIRVIPLPWRRRSTNVFAELRSLEALVRLYRRERPDVVHHVALKPVLYGSLVASLAGTAHVINAVAGFGYSFTSKQRRAAIARRILRASFKRISSRPGTRVLVQNPDDQLTLSGTGTVPAERLVVIPGSGVDVDRFVPRAEPQGVPTVTLVSRMLWSKGVGEFVEAARLLRQRGVRLRAVLVGDPDPENPQSIPTDILERWRDSGVVEWRGHEDDVPAVWAASHVAVLPSYREGLPKTLLEAAACGRPIVTCDVPGCREIVEHGQNGLLVPPHDEVALAAAIEKLVLDPSLRRRMGGLGRSIAVEKFSEQVVIGRVLSLYRSMVMDE
jgi:glycosyltransferase involved in cell wall biosynthesis